MCARQCQQWEKCTHRSASFSHHQPDTIPAGLVDIIAFLQKPAGPPPFQEAGGIAALAPGSTAWLKLDLTSGNYVALCFVPDPTTGKPHVMLGMITTFTIH